MTNPIDIPSAICRLPLLVAPESGRGLKPILALSGVFPCAVLLWSKFFECWCGLASMGAV